MAAPEMQARLSPGQAKHKGIYKKSAPHWKDAYRKRCLDRLKSNREKFLNKLRHSESVVNDLMKEEWRTMNAETYPSTQLVQMKNIFDVDYDRTEKDEDADEVMAILDEIRQELLAEENMIIQEYENTLAFDEAALCAAVTSLSTDEVICPVCKKNILLQNKSVIFCKCGVRIETEQDCLNISHLKSEVEHGVAEHTGLCDAEASFNVVSQLGTDTLMMTCEV